MSKVNLIFSRTRTSLCLRQNIEGPRLICQSRRHVRSLPSWRVTERKQLHDDSPCPFDRRHLFLDEDFFLDDFFGGTFPPSLRASDNPMAIACFLLVTFLPDRPLFSSPFLRSCIAFSTFFCAFLPYLAIVLILLISDQC